MAGEKRFGISRVEVNAMEFILVFDLYSFGSSLFETEKEWPNDKND